MVLKPELPLDPGLTRVIAAVQAGAVAMGVELLLVGAAARDLLLVHVYGQRVRRATKDVDFAVAIASWDAYEQLQKRLMDHHGFRKDSRPLQRLFFAEPGEGCGTTIDLVPFGELQVDQQTLLWPPEMNVMTVAGFEEALRAAVEVELAANLTVKVASLPGLALLKLFAWSDRRPQETKDAVDFHTLLRSYGAAGNFDRMTDPHHQAWDRFYSLDCDEERTGAWLLGMDARSIASTETMASLRELLGEPDRREQLIDDMASGDRGIRGARQRAESMLRLFLEGMG